MTDSQHLIPNGPEDQNAEQQCCYICGAAHAHYAMGHLRVTARFERAHKASLDNRELEVAICPACSEAGVKFALSPLGRTLRQNPMGRAAA